MGNMRQKYTDEEWEQLESDIKKRKESKIKEGSAITNTKGPAETPKPRIQPAPQKVNKNVSPMDMLHNSYEELAKDVVWQSTFIGDPYTFDFDLYIESIKKLKELQGKIRIKYMG